LRGDAEGVAEGGVGEEGGGGEEEVGEGEGEEVAGEVVAVVEHGKGERDNAGVEEGAEEVTGTWEREGVGGFVRGEELEVAGFGGVGVEGVVEGVTVGEGEQVDAEDGEGGGDEDGVEEPFVGCREGEGGEVGEHVKGELEGHGVVVKVVNWEAGEEED